MPTLVSHYSFLLYHINNPECEEFKMKFFVLVFAFVLSTLAVQAQSETESLTAPTPEDEISKIQEKGLVILEIRILAANLPEDLLARGFDIVLNTRIQFDSCKAALEINHIIWQYKVCIITQLKVANIAVTQLEIEAVGRTTTTTSATIL